MIRVQDELFTPPLDIIFREWLSESGPLWGMMWHLRANGWMWEYKGSWLLIHFIRFLHHLPSACCSSSPVIFLPDVFMFSSPPLCMCLCLICFSFPLIFLMFFSVSIVIFVLFSSSYLCYFLACSMHVWTPNNQHTGWSFVSNNWNKRYRFSWNIFKYIDWISINVGTEILTMISSKSLLPPLCQKCCLSSSNTRKSMFSLVYANTLNMVNIIAVTHQHCHFEHTKSTTELPPHWHFIHLFLYFFLSFLVSLPLSSNTDYPFFFLPFSLFVPCEKSQNILPFCMSSFSTLFISCRAAAGYKKSESRFPVKRERLELSAFVWGGWDAVRNHGRCGWCCLLCPDWCTVSASCPRSCSRHRWAGVFALWQGSLTLPPFNVHGTLKHVCTVHAYHRAAETCLQLSCDLFVRSLCLLSDTWITWV